MEGSKPKDVQRTPETTLLSFKKTTRNRKKTAEITKKLSPYQLSAFLAVILCTLYKSTLHSLFVTPLVTSVFFKVQLLQVISMVTAYSF